MYAYGGESAPGIGGGYGGLLDGLTISDGAYVLAQGGLHSPGIGTGSITVWSHPLSPTRYTMNVSNITVSGGDTMVEAIGGAGLSVPLPNTPNFTTIANHPYMPSIGPGGDNNPRLSNAQQRVAGTFTNAKAVPDTANG